MKARPLKQGPDENTPALTIRTEIKSALYQLVNEKTSAGTYHESLVPSGQMQALLWCKPPAVLQYSCDQTPSLFPLHSEIQAAKEYNVQVCFNFYCDHKSSFKSQFKKRIRKNMFINPNTQEK